MAGPAYYLQVLDLAVAELQHGSAADQAKAALLQAHPAHARLGALGPDLLRYTTLDPALLDKVAAAGVAGLSPEEKLQVQRAPLMLCYGSVFRDLVLKLWPFLASVHVLYDQMDAVAAAEDKDGLAGLKGAFDQVAADANALSDLSGTGEQLRKNAIGPAVVLPPVIQTGFPLAIKQWRGFEFLRWVRAGKFARRLRELADASGQPQLQAYALGWLCHVAAAVTGEPFIANVAGGPFRTHWWRNRYAGNFVDAWTHGCFATPATMAGDEPTPAYAAWKPVCGARLHEAVAFTTPAPDGMTVAKGVAEGPVPADLLPADLAALLVKTVQDVYDFPTDLTPPDLKLPETWRTAYAGLYSVLWLTTEGTGPLCPTLTATPPASCTEAPDWVTSGGSPPAPVKETESDSASSVALAILAILSILAGAWVVGLGAIGAAILAAQGGQEVDWEQLRCNLFWQRKKLFDIEQGLRDLLVIAGLAYPAPHQLGTVGPDGKTTPTTGIAESGRALCRAEDNDQRFPLRMDDSVGGLADLGWLKFPPSEVEQPPTHDLQTPVTMGPAVFGYPDVVVAGPLENGGMLADAPTFPTSGVRFGGAVANAVEVIRAGGMGLKDYNLDADRGYGWKGWIPKLGNKPNSGTVDAQQLP